VVADDQQAMLDHHVGQPTTHLSRGLGVRVGFDLRGDNDGDSDEARALRPLQAAACTHRIAFGHEPGRRC